MICSSTIKYQEIEKISKSKKRKRSRVSINFTNAYNGIALLFDSYIVEVKYAYMVYF